MAIGGPHLIHSTSLPKLRFGSDPRLAIPPGRRSGRSGWESHQSRSDGVPEHRPDVLVSRASAS